MKRPWISLESLEGIENLKNRSFEVPCLIFKHSTQCNISSIAKYRLEDDWDWSTSEMEAYYLDLLLFRKVSQQVAETFQVYHESPQVLLIVNGECIYETAHLDIRVAEIRESLNHARI